MMTLTVSEVIELHEKLIHVTGGSLGIRDIALLESAVMGCYQTFSDEDLYPSIQEKAAWLAYAVCKNHPFIDGNKRVAVTAMLVMLRLSGMDLKYTQPELVELGLGVADGSIDYEAIVAWIHSHR